MSKQLVYYPGVIIDRYSVGPYQIEMRSYGRLEGQAECYALVVTRLYTYVHDSTHASIGEAMRAFEKVKEAAIINVGLEAFRLTPVAFAA